MYEKIRESEYGGSPNNVHITRVDSTLSVTMTYPEISENGVKYIEVDQESVRASDGLRLVFGYDRDGWSIQQPTKLAWNNNDDACDQGWTEVYFAQSWHFEKEQKAWEDSL